jgi:hypothetical protein
MLRHCCASNYNKGNLATWCDSWCGPTINRSEKAFRFVASFLGLGDTRTQVSTHRRHLDSYWCLTRHTAPRFSWHRSLQMARLWHKSCLSTLQLVAGLNGGHRRCDQCCSAVAGHNRALVGCTDGECTSCSQQLEFALNPNRASFHRA